MYSDTFIGITKLFPSWGDPSICLHLWLRGPSVPHPCLAHSLHATTLFTGHGPPSSPVNVQCRISMMNMQRELLKTIRFRKGVKLHIDFKMDAFCVRVSNNTSWMSAGWLQTVIMNPCHYPIS